MAKSKRKAEKAVDAVVEPEPPKLELPVVEAPEYGKREVKVEPPIPVRLALTGTRGMVVSAERSAATVQTGEVDPRPLSSASRDRTMYGVLIGESVGTFSAEELAAI